MQHLDNKASLDFEKILEDYDPQRSSVAPPMGLANIMAVAFVALPVFAFFVILFVFYTLRIN